MTKHWTYGRKVGAGFAVTVALAVAIAGVAMYAVNDVVTRKDQVITVSMPMLVDAERLRSARVQKAVAARGYFLTHDPKYLQQIREVRAEFFSIAERLKRGAVDEDERTILDAVVRAESDHQDAIDAVVAMLQAGGTSAAVSDAFDKDAQPARDRLDQQIDAFVSRVENLVQGARTESNQAASSTIHLIVIIAGGAVLLATAMAVILARALNRQVGAAVGQVRNSSAELQAAASQQAMGAREQATAMNEITTTISELLVTSRQIAESAQRVSQIANQTAVAARSGDETVEDAYDAMTGIRQQVDMIVGHMLDLGKKSQQIGTVLDIVSDLAEQTNIVAINATIEAAGAGENGKRFSVVADEIRKLSDRVAGSTKEIRAMIDDVRSAVNTTVMATETGSKAVDAGTKHFGDVASSLKQITGLVSTTTEASREIELSTQQQTTAVEQVNVAVANVAQATRETEASSGQTLQTASQLAALSRDLSRLVEAGAAA